MYIHRFLAQIVDYSDLIHHFKLSTSIFCYRYPGSHNVKYFKVCVHVTYTLLQSLLSQDSQLLILWSVEWCMYVGEGRGGVEGCLVGPMKPFPTKVKPQIFFGGVGHCKMFKLYI